MPEYRLREKLFHFCTPVEEIRFPKKVRYVLYISNEASIPSYPVSLSLRDLMRFFFLPNNLHDLLLNHLNNYHSTFTEIFSVLLAHAIAAMY